LSLPNDKCGTVFSVEWEFQVQPFSKATPVVVARRARITLMRVVFFGAISVSNFSVNINEIEKIFNGNCMPDMHWPSYLARHQAGEIWPTLNSPKFARPPDIATLTTLVGIAT
jgi:hypothetical protein